MSYDKKCHKVHVLWTFCVNGLKGPWKLHVSGFLLCYLRHTCILKYSHTKWDFKKVIKIFYSFFFFFFFLGGGEGEERACCAPPPQICHCLHTHTFIAYWICKFTFTNPVTKKQLYILYLSFKCTLCKLVYFILVHMCTNRGSQNSQCSWNVHAQLG